MVRPHTMFRTFAALLLLAAVVLTGVRLGYWQLDRAAQRVAMAAAIEQGRAGTPLQLDAHTPQRELTAWRAASASGTWLHEYTVLIENRGYQGRPGYWVATPLLLNNPSAHEQAASGPAAVLVLRGWIPRPIGPQSAIGDIPAPKGLQDIKGELLSRVPRIYELWSWSEPSGNALPSWTNGQDVPPPVVQNLDVGQLAQSTGLALLPAVLAADVDNTSNLLQEWPQPSLDADQNRGYALQWFGFAAIAAIAWIVVFWRALQRRRQRRFDSN